MNTVANLLSGVPVGGGLGFPVLAQVDPSFFKLVSFLPWLVVIVILFLPKGVVGSLKQYTGKWFHA